MTLTAGCNMGAATAAVNYVGRGQGSSQGTKPKGTRHGEPTRGSHTNSTKSKTTKPGVTEQKQCGNCGRKHAKSSCPAKGKQCHACKKWNHFSLFCRSKNVNNVDVSKELSDDDLFIDNVESRIRNGQVFAEMEEGPSKQRINFKVDTGSQVNISPFYAFNNLMFKLHSILPKLACPHTMAILCTQNTIRLACTHPGTNRTGQIVSCC